MFHDHFSYLQLSKKKTCYKTSFVLYALKIQVILKWYFAILKTTVNRSLILSFDDCSRLIIKSLINGFLIFSPIKYPLNIFWYLRHNQCIQPTDSFNMWGSYTNKIRIPKNFMLHRHRRMRELKKFPIQKLFLFHFHLQASSLF